MSINSAPLPDEVLEKICHHIACVYKDALPSKLAYECFMYIANKVAIRFAEEALFNQKYAAGSIGITVSGMAEGKLHKIIYYSVLSDMTNPAKFQQAFNNKAQIHTPPEHKKIVDDIILMGMLEQPL